MDLSSLNTVSLDNYNNEGNSGDNNSKKQEDFQTNNNLFSDTNNNNQFGVNSLDNIQNYYMDE